MTRCVSDPVEYLTSHQLLSPQGMVVRDLSKGIPASPRPQNLPQNRCPVCLLFRQQLWLLLLVMKVSHYTPIPGTWPFLTVTYHPHPHPHMGVVLP